jgi:biopolymer transport protein ExbB
MIKIFLNGGPVMWPLLICSIVAIATALERIFFIAREHMRRQPKTVEQILERVEHHDFDGAVKIGKGGGDYVVRVLISALAQRAESFSSAVLRAANLELKQFNRGLAVLDTIITLAPLLGLLGTVTGMIHAFGLLGGRELDAPQAITGGIAQALTATAFGLGIAITALIPFNYLNTRLEEARHDIEDAATQLELHLENCREHKGESK